MKEKKDVPATVDQYIEGFPEEIQVILSKLRAAVKKAAPQAVERISYQMPAFYLNGNLVYFAAFKNHIGFFPTSSGVAAFKKDLAKYATTKGTVHFPLDKPLPLDLIKRIVKFRVKENTPKKAERKTKKGKY